MKKSLLYFAVLGLWGYTNPLHAQNPSDTTNLQQVMVVENRLPVKFNEQNRNIWVINKEQIMKIPGRTLNEILGQIPGIDLRQRGPFGTQADISIDGGSFEQSLILINGVKIIDMQTAHNALNLPLPLDAIERIEVLRGPAARIFGVNSLTGAINIITNTSSENALHAHIYSGTSFKKEKLDSDEPELLWGKGIQLGGQINKNGFNNQIYGSYESGNGYRYNTDFENKKIWLDGNKNILDQHKISWMGGYASSDFGANGFYAAPGDRDSKEIVQTVIGVLEYKNYVNPNFMWTPRVSYRYSYDDYRYFKHDISRARSQHYSHALGFELNSQINTSVGNIGLGLEGRMEEISSSNIGKHQRENYGAYGEFRPQLNSQKWSISLGAYVNYNTDYGWQAYPGLDIGYALNDSWKVVGNSSMGQRIPSFTDLYLNQRPGNIGNENLLSENAWNNEVGIKYFGKKGFFQLSYFHRNIENFIDWVRETTNEPWQTQNFQDNITQGISFSGTYAFNENWNLNSGYTYLNPDIQDALHNSLRSKYGIQTLKNQFHTQLSFQHSNWLIHSQIKYQERISQNDYWVWDARISYNFPKALVYLDIQNLFDVTYIEAEAIPMPGRWFNAGLKYSLSL